MKRKMLIASKQMLKSVPYLELKIGNISIPPLHQLEKNIGVMFDKTLLMNVHIAQLYKDLIGDG